MAQVISASPGVLQAKNTAQGLSTSSTVILEFTTPPNLFRIGCQIAPTVRNLTAFLVEAKFHPDGAYQTISSAVTATPAAPITAASGTLATLAANSIGWFFMDVKGMYAVRISATCATDNTGLIDIFAAGLS